MTILNLPKGVISYHVPLYRLPVVVCTSPKQYNKVRKRLGMEPKNDFGAGCAQYVTNGETNYFLVGVFDGSPSTLVHELAHVAFFLLKLVGVPAMDGEANEAYCYLLGDMFREIAPRLADKFSNEPASKN